MQWTPELPDEARSLVECQEPLLIGVRHHSAGMARAAPLLLDAYQPQAVLVELPPEFSSWLEYLASSELQAPVALAATSQAGLSFYPFADFSPELAAIRWAAANDVPVAPCDLPVQWREEPTVADSREPSHWAGLLARLMRRSGADNVGDLWERMVESPALGRLSDWEQAERTRRAALLFGWALRCNDGTADEGDLRRETYMRTCLEQSPPHSAIIVGSYHAAALLPDPLLFAEQDSVRELLRSDAPSSDAPSSDAPSSDANTALIPYSFPQLDERSGYPAGVRDPLWSQRIWEATSAAKIDQAAAEVAVEVCRLLREGGHAAAAADCQEVLRMARDLARVRGLAAPGRGELIEAMQSCLTQGQLLGRGAAVATALELVMVGDRRGRLPGGVPPCGLSTDLARWLKELRLPSTPQRDPKRMRLDPLRSRLDRARVVLFHRLELCNITYATPVEGEQRVLRENLTQVWDIHWQHATEATIEFAAALGATVQQAAMGALLRLERQASDGRGQPGAEPDLHLRFLRQAADAGMIPELNRGLKHITGEFLSDATLSQLNAAMQLLEQLRHGHCPGAPVADEEAWPGWSQRFEPPPEVGCIPLLEAALARLEGMWGSESPEEAAEVGVLVLNLQQQAGETLAAGRLLWNLTQMRSQGSSLMQGAAWGAQLLLTIVDDQMFGAQLGSWVDGAVDRESRCRLKHRLQGAVLVSSSGWLGDCSCLDGLNERFLELNDDTFLSCLPELRGGFDVLSPGARQRLLDELLQRIGAEPSRDAGWDRPQLNSKRAAADVAGRARLNAWMPGMVLRSAVSSTGSEEQPAITVRAAQNQISAADRWRLVLGVPANELPAGMTGRCAAALDELYGRGRGEGRRPRGAGRGSGAEAGFPDVRVWSEELEALFGADVREEVLGSAAAGGRLAALDLLDPDEVTPSVDLLQQVLSLRGSMAAGRSEQLRKLARRVTEQLADQLAQRLRPALTGLSTPRPTRRPTRKLDLNRTIRANLRTAVQHKDGAIRLTPERMIFRARAKRTMDWHVTFVVDISGSMEASVIYSALVAAILNDLPALSVQFLAFNTEVIEFTEHVDDPLSLLLEVQVGGGTYIAKGLNAARQRLRVPSRSIVLLVTDFEEGGSVGRLLGEVEALLDTGARLLGLAALNDDGAPRYHQGIAQRCAMRGMPIAALSPLELAQWVGEQIR